MLRNRQHVLPCLSEIFLRKLESVFGIEISTPQLIAILLTAFLVGLFWILILGFVIGMR